MSVEAWARAYVESSSLAYKLSPPPPPSDFSPSAAPLRLERPGRPPELVRRQKHAKAPKAGALVHPEKRARLLHGFLHHELQAAELMCWAILAFPDAPPPFRRGLLKVAQDELRHMAMYRARVEALGHAYGEFEVRDWFWTRVPLATRPAQFVATMGVGLEGGNLDHARRYREALLAAGDPESAAVEAQVGREEIPHCAFALHWLEAFTGSADFDRWTEELVPPLSPMMMRGSPLNLEDRRRAGYSEDFLARLAAWTP